MQWRCNDSALDIGISGVWVQQSQEEKRGVVSGHRAVKSYRVPCCWWRAISSQPMLCYANSSALYAENDPFLPFLNKIDFILSFYCRLSCLWKAVIWWCLMVRVCLCVPRERGGGVSRLNSWAVKKRIALFGAEFNEMINDPQDSHSQQGEKENEGAEDSIGLLQLYVSCGPPLKMWIVFETWNPSFWLQTVWFPLMQLRQTETGLGLFILFSSRQSLY